jgi:16S rRNA (cytosine967-C5)-methyltransferase
VSRVDNQRRLFLELVEELRPHWRRDRAQPRRLADWLSRHRAGSRDRRLYRELTYTLWRILPWVEDAAPDILLARVANHAHRLPATAGFIDTFANPAITDPGPTSSLLPDWLNEQCPAALVSPEINSLLSRAPLWIRQQGASPDELSVAFPEAVTSLHVTGAWRLPSDTPVMASPLYRQGLIEVQDAGSQALLLSVPELPTGRWLDACAGAGGKSLQLAQLLHTAGRGEVIAHDVRPTALRELEQRRQRAGLSNITTTRKLTGTFDGVLVDAPCTGSGTWRRAPHLKWTIRPQDPAAAHERQLHVLSENARHVATGGLLLYATCSLCQTENEAVAAAFLAAHSHFRPAPLRHPKTGASLSEGRLNLLPSQLDSDGYFLAAFRRS